MVMKKFYGVILLDKDGDVLLAKESNIDICTFPVVYAEEENIANEVQEKIGIDITVYTAKKIVTITDQKEITYVLARTKNLEEPMREKKIEGFAWYPLLLVGKKIKNELTNVWIDAYANLAKVLGLKEEKSCGAIITNNKGQVLLIQQANCLVWSFPKGHVEEGETEVETAMREVKEETGLDVEIDATKRYALVYCQRAHILKEVVFFLAKAITEDVVIEKELQDYKWCNIEEVNDVLTYSDLREIFEKAKKTINK